MRSPRLFPTPTNAAISSSKSNLPLTLNSGYTYMEQVWLIRLVVVVGWLEEEDDAYLFCLWIHDHSARSLDWGSRDDYRGRTSVISDRNVHLTSQTLLIKTHTPIFLPN